MTTVAYIANEFPSPLEPYVMDEVHHLRRLGLDVICCSGKRVSPRGLNLSERAYWKETRYFQPLSDDALRRAARRLASDRRALWQITRPLLFDRGASPLRRVRTLGHTLMGAALAEELHPLGVRHIHAHHGYFASWMALTAARLLGISFSFTLHGSDLLQRADLLAPKLRACRFCVTVSDYNRRFVLQKYPFVPPENVWVRRLGVDRVLHWPASGRDTVTGHPRFCLLSVGRLHAVKNHRFLIDACAHLRAQNFDFLCWIVGEGPERPALERQIRALGLEGRVYLAGQIPRAEISSYYEHADLVVLTSHSEGIPVTLMEAMAHEKLVLAPAITGIPELVEHQHTGFLYPPGNLSEFAGAVQWIHAHHASLAAVRRAAAVSIDANYNRQRNLRAFARQFLACIPESDVHHAHPVLQQVRLSV